MTAQWLTTVIARDHHTNIAGVAHYTVNRWAGTAAEVDAHAVQRAVDELEAAGRLLVDEPHSYVWLVDHMHNNRIFSQPNSVRSALKTVERVDSLMIREAVAQQVALYAADAALVIGRQHRKDIPPAVRLLVYERDAWSCQDCERLIKPVTDGQLTGAEAPFDETGWLELDHVHPHSHDGADDADNLRALCSPCNRLKGARILAGVSA